jgi:hypothetical protein
MPLCHLAAVSADRQLQPEHTFEERSARGCSRLSAPIWLQPEHTTLPWQHLFAGLATWWSVRARHRAVWAAHHAGSPVNKPCCGSQLARGRGWGLAAAPARCLQLPAKRLTCLRVKQAPRPLPASEPRMPARTRTHARTHARTPTNKHTHSLYSRMLGCVHAWKAALRASSKLSSCMLGGVKGSCGVAAWRRGAGWS